MKFENSHKALAITLLIVGTLVLSVVNIELYQYNTEATEILVDISPEAILEVLEEETKDHSPRTNKGFNDAKKQKHFAHAYKIIAPPKDFDDPRLANLKNDDFKMRKASKNNSNTSIKNDDLTSFESTNSILSKRTKAIKNSQSEASFNKNSSIIYSLKNRTDTYLPIPIYLCEANGKIVVNITVNQNGKVTNSSINNAASNSNSECLQQHAIEFAKNATFNAASKMSQIGTITFYFDGK